MSRRVEGTVASATASAAADQVQPAVPAIVAPPIIPSGPVRRLLEKTGPPGPSFLIP